MLGGHLDDLDDDVWEQIVGEVDTNGDGVISREEFTAMMLRYADIEEIQQHTGQPETIQTVDLGNSEASERYDNSGNITITENTEEITSPKE